MFKGAGINQESLPRVERTQYICYAIRLIANIELSDLIDFYETQENKEQNDRK